MLPYDFFLDLAIILISTKVLGLLTRKIQMPQVVGALLAGLILGPAFLDILQETHFIDQMAELGVIALMFTAGLETDIKELKKSGKASMIIALAGVILPLIGGFIISAFFNAGSLFQMAKIELLQNFFIGVVLTATSVSITVETLREMGKFKTSSGTAILGAAIIDDILGIIALTIISSFANPSVSILSVVLRVVLFFIFAAIGGIISYYIFKQLSMQYGRKRRIPIYGLVFCLILAYAAERFFGIADITGAYLAGIIISNIGQSRYISGKIEIMSYMLLSPVFFASIGIKTNFLGINGTMIIFAIIMLLIAILTKVVGCGFGAKLSGFTNQESLRIGIGMVSRGEVALIIADKGVNLGIMKEQFFAPLILVVIITTLITPILLNSVYSHNK